MKTFFSYFSETVGLTKRVYLAHVSFCPNNTSFLTNLLDSKDTFFTKDLQSFITNMKAVADNATEVFSQASQESDVSVYASFTKKYIEIVPFFQSQITKYKKWSWKSGIMKSRIFLKS